jgi:hypothetical protein
MANVDILVRMVDQTKSGASSALAQIGKMAAGYLSAATVIDAFGKAVQFSIDQAAEAQKVDAQLGAVLQSTGSAAGMARDELDTLAESLSKVSTYDDEAIKSSEALLLTFTNIGSEVFPAATQSILDMSSALGQDLKSSTIQLGKALNDPIQGITALSRVGVSFTEDQKKMISTLVETGDTLGAQKVILDELTKEFGGSASAAANTYTGQIAQLKNELGNLGEVMGSDMLPELTTFVKESKSAVEWVTKNYEEIKKWADVIAWVANPLGKAGTELGVFFRHLVFGEEAIDSATQSYTEMARVMSSSSNAVSNLTSNTVESEEAAKKQAEAIKYMTEVNREYLSLVGDMTNEYASQDEKLSDLNSEHEDLLAQKKKLIDEGWWAESEKVTEVNEKIDENREKYSEATNEFELNTRRRILSMLEEQLSLDGLSAEEQDILLAKGLAWGVYSQQAVDATKAAMEEVRILTDAINTIPSERTFTMSVLVQGADAVGGLGAGFGNWEGRAGGGTVEAGRPYTVGENGREVFVPDQSGKIVPNNQLTSSENGAGNNTALLSAVKDMKIDYGKMARAIANAMQQAG